MAPTNPKRYPWKPANGPASVPTTVLPILPDELGLERLLLMPQRQRTVQPIPTAQHVASAPPAAASSSAPPAGEIVGVQRGTTPYSTGRISSLPAGVPKPAQDPRTKQTKMLLLQVLLPVTGRREPLLARTHPTAMPTPALDEVENLHVLHQRPVPKQVSASPPHAVPG